MLKKCTCKHKYQDKKYGKKMRIHNECNQQNGVWRCTICKDVKR